MATHLSDTASVINNIEIIDYIKNTNLHVYALNGNHNELMKFKPGTKIDVQNSLGLTPLMCAVRRGHLEAVKTLLDLRADATKVNVYGGSVFLMACASGDLDVINILLRHLLSGGVSRQAIESKFSPIAISILFGHEHVFKFLLGNKFNVQSLSLQTELTPLMFAALSENPKFKQHLLLLGADSHVRNANGETCYDLERRFNGPVVSEKNQEHKKHKDRPDLHVEIPQHTYQVQQPQPPLIIVGVQHQPIYNMLPVPRPRKSSNICTPIEALTPMVSPIECTPQVFFPMDFSAAYSSQGSPFYCIAPPSYLSHNQEYVMSPVFQNANILSPFPCSDVNNVSPGVFLYN